MDSEESPYDEVHSEEHSSNEQPGVEQSESGFENSESSMVLHGAPRRAALKQRHKAAHST